MDDIMAFARLLLKSRSVIKKSRPEVAKQLAVITDCVTMWENGECFPENYRLKLIASVYKVGLKKLRRAFEISKKARGLEKEIRRARKIKSSMRHEETDLFPGAIVPGIKTRVLGYRRSHH